MGDSLDSEVTHVLKEFDEPLASLPTYDEAMQMPDSDQTEKKRPFPDQDYYNLADEPIRSRKPPNLPGRQASREDTDVKRPFTRGCQDDVTEVKLRHNGSNDDTSQTEVKAFHREESGDWSDSDDVDLPVSEREELMAMIQQMQEEQERQRQEQERIKRNQEREIQELRMQQRQEHVEVMRRQLEQFKQFEEFVKSKPRLSKKVKSIKRNSELGFAGAAFQLSAAKSVAQQFSSGHIYVQIQALYANMHRMTLVSPGTTMDGQDDESVYETIGEMSNLLRDTDRAEAYGTELRERVTELSREREELTQENLKLKKSLLQLQTDSDPHRHHMMRTRSEEPSHGEIDDYVMVTSPRQRNPPRPHNPPRLVSVPVEATFQWTLTDYCKKLKFEQENMGKRVLSHQFYIHHKSYRCQLEAYLNGNGPSALGRCMSIFLRVVRGEYDEVLSWPVELNPTFILVNQADKNNSIKATGNIDNFFRYKRCSDGDTESSNVWGLLEFVTHEMIHQGDFVKDNTLQLQCRISVVRDSTRSVHRTKAIPAD